MRTRTLHYLWRRVCKNFMWHKHICLPKKAGFPFFLLLSLSGSHTVPMIYCYSWGSELQKMLNVNKSHWMETSKRMLQHCCFTCKNVGLRFGLKLWQKHFSWLKLIKNVFLFLFCNATMLSCMLNCSKTQQGWFTSSQMHQIESQCRCHRDFLFYSYHKELWYFSVCCWC